MKKVKQHRWRFFCGALFPVSINAAVWWIDSVGPLEKIPQPLQATAAIVGLSLLVVIPIACFSVGMSDFENEREDAKP